MTSRTNALESHLFSSYWDDGLLDVFAGLGVVGISLFWTFDLVALGAIVPAILAVFWGPLRSRFVEPRAGFVEFSDARSQRTDRLLRGAVLLGIANLAVFVGLYIMVRSEPGALLPLVGPGLPAFLVAVAAVLAGWGLGLSRFLVYASVLCIGGFGVAAAGERPEVAMAVGGLAALVNGGWRFSRFLRLPAEPDEARQ
jgi:hypothetical protein